MDWRRPWKDASKRQTLIDVGVLAGIVALAVVCRGVYWHQLGGTLFGRVAIGPDVREYDAWARNILGGDWLWTRVQPHAPLYPFLLATLYAITHTDLMAVRALQLALDVLSLLLVYGALRFLLDRRVAIIAGLLWALYLPLIYFSGEVFCEGLLVFCLAAAFFLYGYGFGRDILLTTSERPMVCAVLAGVMLGLAAITHPIVLPFGLATAAFVGWRSWQSGGARRGVALAALTLTGLLLPILPVTARNRAVSGEFVLIQGNEGLNFYIGNNPQATGTPYVRSGDDFDKLVNRPATVGANTERGATRFFYAKAWTFIRDQPGAWLRLLLRKLALTWSGEEIPSGPDLPSLQVQTSFMGLPLLRFGIIGPLAFAGLWFCRRRRDVWIFPLCVVCCTLVLTVFVTSGRYRLCMVPAVLILAAIAVDGFLQTWEREDGRSLVIGVILTGSGLLLALLARPPALPQAEAESALLHAEAAWYGKNLFAAQQWLGRTLELDPTNATANHLAGVVLQETGRPADAIAYFHNALERRPNDVRLRTDLANALSQVGRRADAREEYAAALALDSGSAEVWYNLGVLLEQQGDTDRARECYQKALLCCPGFTSAHLNLRVLHHRNHEYDSARVCYTRALRLAPGKPRTLTCLAVLCADTGDAAGARRFFEQSLHADPRQPDVWVAYIRFLRAQSEDLAAEAALRQACDANPGFKLAD